MKSALAINKVRKWTALPLRQKAMLLQAAWLLGVARLLVILAPFRIYARWLGRRGAQSGDAPLPPSMEQLARDIGWAVTVAAGHVPWKAECLPQAMAARWLLRRHRVPVTLYLGAAKNRSDLLLHAWLRAGNIIVTGQSQTDFAVIASFA